MAGLVLIIGSAPDAVRARDFDCSGFEAIVAINNAWQIREDWTHSIYPEDFSEDRRPVSRNGQITVTHEEFVPANNVFGGVVYVGGTMAFTAGYWALHTLKPEIMAFIGCDMAYAGDGEQTHFYGRGEPDPLRDDPTLQNLPAKANRLNWFAAEAGCVCVNLSKNEISELTFPRADIGSLRDHERLQVTEERALSMALEAEKQAACFVESGDYWNTPEKIDPNALNAIDQLWLKAFG